MLYVSQILLYLVIIGFNVLYDEYQIDTLHKSPNHFKHTVLVMTLVTTGAVLFNWLGCTYLHFVPLIMFPAVRWFLHDILLNLLCGKKWNYIGIPEDSEEDAVLDDYLQRKPAAQFYKKALLLVISVIVSIFAYITLK